MTTKVKLQTKACVFCDKTHEVEVPFSGVDAYMNGANIQDAFPTLSDDEREMIISGTCPECWKKHMSGE